MRVLRPFVTFHALLATVAAQGALGAQAEASASLVAIRERAISMFADGRLGESKTLLLPLATRSRDHLAAYYLGRIAYQQDSADVASKWFENARETLDTSAVFHLWSARILGARARRSNMFRAPVLGRQAKAELDRALQIDPSNEDARVELIHFFATAPGILGGSVAQALIEAERLQSSSPYQGGLQKGWVEERARNAAEAERVYRGLVQDFPDSVTPRVAYVILLENGTRYQEAFALIDQRLQQAHADFAILYQMGRLAAISDNWQDMGTAALQRFLGGPASETRLQVGSAHWRLGMIAEQRGDSSLARREYALAIQLDTTLQEPRVALKRLSRR